MTTIVQYSIPRTGSTLVTQILKQVFPNKKIFKTHTVIEGQLPVVSTYRDFRDVLVSGWRVHNDIPLQDLDAGRKMSKIEFRKNLDKLIYDITLMEKMKSHHKDNMLLLQYELFIHDYDYIFNELERFFQIIINDNQRQLIKDNSSLKKNLVRSARFKTFRKQWDKNTLIHGLHIYQDGKPGIWKKLIPSDLHDDVNAELKDFLIRWGYECQ